MAQPDFTKMEDIVAELSDPKSLEVLRSACKGLDKYFGLVGVEDVAAVLANGLENVFQRNQATFARMQRLLQAVQQNSTEEIPYADLEAIASLLAEVIDENDELRNEVTGILRRELMKGIAETRRRGESSFWTEIEDKRHEQLLMREYAGIEAKILSRLKDGLRAHAQILIPAFRTKAADFSAIEAPKDVRPSEKQLAPIHHLTNTAESNLLSWDEVQAILKSDPTFFGGDWQREPRKTLLWIWQNGTQEQWCAYLYKNADMIDEELRSIFLEAFTADEERQIPTVWRTVLIRALSRVGKVSRDNG